MYLTAKRLGVMLVVSLISKFMESPKEMHLPTAKKIIWYLNSTRDLRFLYLLRAAGDLVYYSDTDYAGNLEDTKSTPRYVFMLGFGVIS